MARTIAPDAEPLSDNSRTTPGVPRRLLSISLLAVAALVPCDLSAQVALTGVSATVPVDSVYEAVCGRCNGWESVTMRSRRRAAAVRR